MTSGNESWRVVIFTVTAMAATNLEERLNSYGHRVVGILTAPGPRSRRTDGYLEVAQVARPGLDVIVSNYPKRWAKMIEPWRPDLIVCGSFNWKIPDDVLALTRLGAINGHDALLPLNRGRNATGWALRNGTPYGVSVHYMTPAFDDGPVLSQRPIPITDEDYSIDSIFPRFQVAMAEATNEALEKIAAGDPGIPQDESKATYAGGAFEPEWREIDWSDPARHTFVKVRSWYGARDVPLGAFGEIEGQRCLITSTKLTTRTPTPRSREPSWDVATTARSWFNAGMHH